MSEIDEGKKGAGMVFELLYEKIYEKKRHAEGCMGLYFRLPKCTGLQGAGDANICFRFYLIFPFHSKNIPIGIKKKILRFVVHVGAEFVSCGHIYLSYLLYRGSISTRV